MKIAIVEFANNCNYSYSSLPNLKGYILLLKIKIVMQLSKLNYLVCQKEYMDFIFMNIILNKSI